MTNRLMHFNTRRCSLKMEDRSVRDNGKCELGDSRAERPLDFLESSFSTQSTSERLVYSSDHVEFPELVHQARRNRRASFSVSDRESQRSGGASVNDTGQQLTSFASSFTLSTIPTDDSSHFPSRFRVLLLSSLFPSHSRRTSVNADTRIR